LATVYARNSLANLPTLPTPTDAFQGGLDEPWDAADLQNMYLAMVPPRAAETIANNNPFDWSSYSDDLPIMPSFHRPELIYYWINYLTKNFLPSKSVPGTTAAQVDAQFSIIMYPYGLDGKPNT